MTSTTHGCVLEQKHAICVAMSDLVIAIYSDEDFSVVGRLPVFTYPQVLFWSEEADRLYCGGADGAIRVYTLEPFSLVQTLKKVRQSHAFAFLGLTCACCPARRRCHMLCSHHAPQSPCFGWFGLQDSIMGPWRATQTERAPAWLQSRRPRNRLLLRS